jgi:hypothetical protein
MGLLRLFQSDLMFDVDAQGIEELTSVVANTDLDAAM